MATVDRENDRAAIELRGPFCNGSGDWWVLTDGPAEALAEVVAHSEVPSYFGPTWTVTRCTVRPARTGDDDPSQTQELNPS
jgi:hypothetical protein